MTIQYVKEYFLDKKLIPCPLTEELVIAGYQQVSGGYIDRAKKSGIKVNYKDNAPSQYWHLMTYCDSRDGDIHFSNNIVCGELIFWMAVVVVIGLVVCVVGLQKGVERVTKIMMAALFIVLIIAGGFLPEIPVTRRFSFNVGGALIPLGLCVYLLVVRKGIEYLLHFKCYLALACKAYRVGFETL